MSDSDRLANMLYAMLFYEESRLEAELENSFYILKQFNDNLHYIEKYRQCVQRYDDFKILQKKVIEVLKLF